MFLVVTTLMEFWPPFGIVGCPFHFGGDARGYPVWGWITSEGAALAGTTEPNDEEMIPSRGSDFP